MVETRMYEKVTCITISFIKYVSGVLVGWKWNKVVLETLCTYDILDGKLCGLDGTSSGSHVTVCKSVPLVWMHMQHLSH